MRGCKTPVELLKETGSNISPKIFNLPPIILDNYIDELLNPDYRAVISHN
ncbi:MAG: hypothetical protein ABIK19_04320 [candidate division WOR-3 bacterium]